jgi:RND family efflux transporter MFP subunit
VSSETTGRLAEVLVEEGSRVRKGQLVARLDSRDAQLQVRLAESQLESARLVAARQKVDASEAREYLVRMRTLHDKKFVSDDQLKTSEYAVKKQEAGESNAANDVVVAERRLAIQRQFLENMNIVAPFDGLVTERAAQVGEIVSPISAGGGFTRTGICTLVDVDSIAAHVRINEKYIGRVRLGQTVTIVPRAYPELRLRGRVETIMPALERETASVEVIVALLDHDSRVLPNMSIDASFDAAEPGPLASAGQTTGRVE